METSEIAPRKSQGWWTVVPLVILLLVSSVLFIKANHALSQASENVSVSSELLQSVERSLAVSSRMILLPPGMDGRAALLRGSVKVSPEAVHELARLALVMQSTYGQFLPTAQAVVSANTERALQAFRADVVALSSGHFDDPLVQAAYVRMVTISSDAPAVRLLQELPALRSSLMDETSDLRFQRGLAVGGILLSVAVAAVQALRRHSHALKVEVEEAEMMRASISRQRDAITDRQRQRQDDLRGIRDKTVW